MNGGSKELADAGSFGLMFDFHAPTAVPADKFILVLEDMLEEVGERVMEQRGSLLGHIKAFVTTPHGTLKVNLIDLELGPDTLNRLSSPSVSEGHVKIMAALVGLTDHEVEEMMEESLEPLHELLEFEVEEHEHEHEH